MGHNDAMIALALLAAALSPAQRAEIKAMVSPHLRDPDSAVYRWPMPKPGHVYCGWVNAKNGYGGYNGFRQFAVIRPLGGFGKTEILFAWNPGDHDSSEALFACQKAGYDIDIPPSSSSP